MPYTKISNQFFTPQIMKLRNPLRKKSSIKKAFKPSAKLKKYEVDLLLTWNKKSLTTVKVEIQAEDRGKAKFMINQLLGFSISAIDEKK